MRNRRFCHLSMWPDRRLLESLNIDHPIVQAPMAGAMDWELVAAVAEAGGLGSLPCAMLTPQQLIEQVDKIRSRTRRPINVNFFCHKPPRVDNAREAAWRDRLAPYYHELGLDPNAAANAPSRAPFNEAMCDVIVELSLPWRASISGFPRSGCWSGSRPPAVRSGARRPR